MMSAGLRKLMLTLHITASVGWLGAVVAYMALAITVQTSTDNQTIRAAYISLEPVTRYVIVPFSLAALFSGIVQSLGTSWGLLRHYWIIFKLMLTIFAVAVLMTYTPTVSQMASAAADPTVSTADLQTMGAGLPHAVGALIVLLITTFLSVFKPRGMTRYGWRQQRMRRTS